MLGEGVRFEVKDFARLPSGVPDVFLLVTVRRSFMFWETEKKDCSGASLLLQC